MTTPPFVRRRRRWPWILGIAVVLIAVVASIALIVERMPSSPPTSAGPTATQMSPTSDRAQGCLGGSDRSAATVLSAQTEAAHNTVGAVSYAATFARWIYQIPTPDDINAVAATNLLPNSVWEGYRSSASSWEGPSPVYATTLTSRYRIEADSSDRVEVTLVLPWVIDDAVVPTKRFVPTLTVEWIEGQWSVTDARGDHAEDPDLAELGSPLDGGC